MIVGGSLRTLALGLGPLVAGTVLNKLGIAIFLSFAGILLKETSETYTLPEGVIVELTYLIQMGHVRAIIQ